MARLARLMARMPAPQWVMRLAVMALIWASGATMSMAAETGRFEAPTILLISSFAKDLPAQEALERGLERALGHRSGHHRMFFEFLDIPRLPAEQAVEAVAAVIGPKYRGIRFDAVVGWGVPAAQVVAKLGPVLDGASLHFLEVAPAALASLGLPIEHAYIFRPDYAATLTETLRLTQAERIVLIGEGNATGMIRLERLRTELAAHPHLAVEEWLDRPLDELQERAALLPPHTLVFYLLMFSDGRGVSLTPFEAARRLAERSAAPIFTQWESLMGSGVVGGYVLSIEEMGHILGLRIIGSDAAAVPAEAMRYTYDWPQMVRWGFDKATLPAEALILNREPSPLEQYRWHIATITAFIVALVGLSLFLARALRLRNQAMADLAAARDALEERVRERTDALARSNAELEQFAYAISHDLRQPLRMVSSFLSLLKRRLGPALDADGQQFIGFAVDGAKRMDAMILSLLEYSRVGRKGEPPAWVDSRKSLDEALSFLRPAIAECAAEITVSGTWPRLFVMPDAFERVLLNLVGNAVKYRVAGTAPRIELAVEASGSDWLFSVKDNGIGIDPGGAPRLFKVFQRLTSVEAYEGSGVGLALCRRIVEKQGGRIWMESDGLGHGSVFRFTVPRDTAFTRL